MLDEKKPMGQTLDKEGKRKRRRRKEASSALGLLALAQA